MAVPNGRLAGGIEKSALDFRTAQAVLLNEMAQRLLNSGMESVGQLIGVGAVGGGQDKGFDGGQQRAVTREPDAFVGPDSSVIKAGDFGQRVEASALRVAGQITELLELAENGEVDGSAEHAFEFGQIGDAMAAQMLAEDRGGKDGWSHYVRVPTRGSF